VRKWLWNAQNEMPNSEMPCEKIWMPNSEMLAHEKMAMECSKCDPTRRQRDRWLDLVFIETMYIYLGIFKGRFYRFWEGVQMVLPVLGRGFGF
jgi:hypothetical protein